MSPASYRAAPPRAGLCGVLTLRERRTKQQTRSAPERVERGQTGRGTSSRYSVTEGDRDAPTLPDRHPGRNDSTDVAAVAHGTGTRRDVHGYAVVRGHPARPPDAAERRGVPGVPGREARQGR